MMKIKNTGRRRLRLGMVTLNQGQTADVPDDEGEIILRKFPEVSNVTPKPKYSRTPKKKLIEPAEEPVNLDLKLEVENNDIK